MRSACPKGPPPGLRGGHHVVGPGTELFPLAGTPFDNDLNGDVVSGYDGFVAVFDPLLTTLVYSTYLGSNHNGTPDGSLIQGDHHWEDITSIRALSDTSFAVGGTMGGTLGTSAAGNVGDPIYITANAADGTRDGAPGATPSDATTDTYMYIATFSPFNVLTYGTYVDQTEDFVLNDLIRVDHGRLAFAGTADCDESAPDGTGDEDCTNNGFPALVVQPPPTAQGTPASPPTTPTPSSASSTRPGAPSRS